MTNSEDEHDVLGRKPAILGDVSVPAARKDELATALLRSSPEQRMLRDQLERLADAQDLLTCFSRVLESDEVTEPFEVRERPLRYFDGRHARALGRRAFMPDARAVK